MLGFLSGALKAATSFNPFKKNKDKKAPTPGGLLEKVVASGGDPMKQDILKDVPIPEDPLKAMLASMHYSETQRKIRESSGRGGAFSRGTSGSLLTGPMEKSSGIGLYNESFVPKITEVAPTSISAMADVAAERGLSGFGGTAGRAASTANALRKDWLAAVARQKRVGEAAGRVSRVR
jgi:hypothetical protein